MAEDWSGYDSGPFCEHWRELHACKETCAHCGHYCKDHGETGRCEVCRCKCKEFKDKGKEEKDG